MDILLDSNIYLEDLRMAGNQFAELFDYTRRTGSRVLLPDLVREEVTTAYLRRLKEASRKGRSAHENLWKLSGSEAPQFKAPDFGREVDTLVKRMKHPSKGISVVEVGGYDGVEVRDVVQRGVHRKRPASEAGEELRDVILWFLVLGLAKSSRSGIAFISNDKTFASENGQTLHPELLADVSSSKVKLDFYLNIREFVVAKALDHESVNPEWFFSVVPLKQIEGQTTSAILGASTRVGNIVAVDLKEIGLERATRYKVGARAYFVEALFHGGASLTVEEFPAVTYGNWVSEPTTELSAFYKPTKFAVQVAPAVAPAQTSPYIQAFYPDYPLTPQYLSFNNLSVFSSTPNLTVQAARADSRKYLCTFKATFSARAINDKLESLELDGIQFKSFLVDEGQ